MEHLLPLNSSTCLPCLVILGAMSCLASDYCSLIIHVSNEHGYKPTGVPVTVTESNGRVETATTQQGEVKFCDLGISSVTVAVGEKTSCSQVSINNVPMEWGRGKSLGVIYDPSYCNRDEVHATGCFLILRFIDELGYSIPDVRLDSPNDHFHNVTSDGYGRVGFHLKNRETLRIGASASGFKFERLELPCNSVNDNHEVLVTLHHSK